jgi:hypothetical protein
MKSGEDVYEVVYRAPAKNGNVGRRAVEGQFEKHIPQRLSRDWFGAFAARLKPRPFKTQIQTDPLPSWRDKW